MPRKNAHTSPTPRRPSRGSFNEAAARCRGKTWAGSSPASTSTRGFNEAAARCRGKTWSVESNATLQVTASMRPRPDAAEKRAEMRADRGSATSFNEAAARCRGKTLRWNVTCPPVDRGFNEAAARCRGKTGARITGAASA